MIKSKQWKVLGMVLVLAGAGILSVQAQEESGDSGKVSYVERQKQRLEKELELRLASMQKRFISEQAFRAKAQQQRITFETNLMEAREAFLEKANQLSGDARDKAWDNFYLQERAKRRSFNAQLRAQSNQFWDSIRSQNY